MKTLYITAAVAALLLVFGGPAQAFEFRVENMTRHTSPTVPSIGTQGYCWDTRDGAGQCQYH